MLMKWIKEANLLSLDEVAEMLAKNKANENGFELVRSTYMPIDSKFCLETSTFDQLRIWAEPANRENKINALDNIIKKSQLFGLLRNKIESDDLIAVKTNLATASQIDYHNYTDPVLVDHLVDVIENNGYSNVVIVESPCNALLGYPELTPDNMGRLIKFRHPIHDLSKDRRIKIQFKKKSVDFSAFMLHCKSIINFAKSKNHDLMFFTGALKNMYGTYPDADKYRLFHHKKSGFYIPEATWMVNHVTPPTFNIVDMVDSIDGEQVAYLKKEVGDFPHYQSNLIIAGEVQLAIDKFLAYKMGYEELKMPMLQAELTFARDYTIQPSMVEGSLIPFPNWRRVSGFLNFKAKFIDKLPVSDDLIGAGIRMYKFPIIDKDYDMLRFDEGV